MSSEIFGVLTGIFEKIGTLFDILDLSFFISGAVCLGAIAFWVQLSGMITKLGISPTEGLGFIGVLIACYVLGLISFASGRWIRKGYIARFIGWGMGHIKRPFSGNTKKTDEFEKLLDNHQIMKHEPFKSYIVKNCLYPLMWAELRQSEDLEPSFKILNKWWVMAATYDGIAIGLLVWAIVITACVRGIGVCDEMKFNTDIHISTALFTIFVILSIASFREAGRLERNQREELVATIAYKYHSNAQEETPENDEEGGEDNG